MGLRIGVDGRYLRDDHPGIARHLYHSLRALADDAGADDELLVLHDPRAARARLDPASLVGPRLRLLEAPIEPRSLREQAALPLLVRRLRLDAFHAPYPFTALACPCPRIVTVYDLIALHARHGLRSPLRRALAGLALRRVARGAAALLTLSQAVRAQVVARYGVPAARVAVVGAAADPIFRPASRESVAAARRALDLPERYVLHVGAAKPHKNLARLRAAWQALRRDDVVLVLAGSAARETRDGVRALGPVDDVHLPALYSAAELLVVPSLDEGFGLPVLEAMSCGTPVACADRAVLREVAGDAAAAWFDPEDSRAMAATLNRLLDDAGTRRDLGRRGLERSRRFSWASVAARTWAAWRAAAAARVHTTTGGDPVAAAARGLR